MTSVKEDTSLSDVLSGGEAGCRAANDVWGRAAGDDGATGEGSLLVAAKLSACSALSSTGVVLSLTCHEGSYQGQRAVH